MGLGLMMVLAFLRIPIAYAMGIVGIVGYAYMRDWNWWVAFATAQTKIYETGRNYTLSVVPLFILMGSLVTRAGMSQELFRAAYTFIGHFRGGLAMATVWASAGFGGICGSSIATAATMAKVAYPSMKRFGYHDQLAAGTVAGAGTLGIMIPPSTIMIIYGVFTETNIGKLFAAGVLPGILGAVLLCGAIVCTTWRHPDWGPPRPAVVVARAIQRAEGRVGGRGALRVRDGRHLRRPLHRHRGGGDGGDGRARLRGGAPGAHLADALRGAARVRAHHRDAVHDPDRRADVRGVRQHHHACPPTSRRSSRSLGLSPLMVVAAICAIYVVLGTAMEELSMVLLTMPVFFPVIVHLGLDPVWFGIIIVCVVEIGLISPPVGMNMFVLKSLLPHVSTGTVFRGVMPFMWADVIRLAILVAFPIISLWLPSLMR